jgi:hypothetical protein
VHLKFYKILITACLILMSNLYVYSQSMYQDFTDVKNKIDKAYYTFDAGSLNNLLKISITLEKKYSGEWLPYYYSGILCLQIGKILYLPNPDKAYDYFDKSIDYLLKAKEKNNNAEILALISSAYGKKSSLSTIKAIIFGIKAKDYIYDANKLDSNNAKVYLVAATHLMHTPESFGGDKQWAEQLLKKAIKLIYKKDKKDDLTVNWGSEAEIYAYLAQLEILRENKSKAQLYIDKALTLVPNYGFVKEDLMRQMKRLK